MYCEATMEAPGSEAFLSGRLRPIYMELPELCVARPNRPASQPVIDDARAAIAHGFEPAEWVIDRVVDRMLHELSW